LQSETWAKPALILMSLWGDRRRHDHHPGRPAGHRAGTV
jgi:hypothetical protein